MHRLAHIFSSRRARLTALLALVACAGTTVAYGYFTATSTPGSTDPVTRARTLPTPAAPTASASGTSVTVTITQDSLAGKKLGEHAGGGYRLRRYAGTATVDGTGVTPNAGCSSTLSGSTATLTCTETNVPSGDWKYTATPVLNAWTGGESAASAVVAGGPADTTAPALQKLEMLDADNDGKVDRVDATFDEALASSTATGPWTLSNAPSGATLAGVSTSGSVATLTLNEGSGAASTAVGTFSVALAASASGIRDAAGNQSSFSAQAPSDKARPVVTRLVLSNTAKNGIAGKIEDGDSLVATYSEPLRAASICPLWTGSTTSLTANNDVTVTVADGGTGNDSLSVSAASCSNLRFGTIDLGSVAFAFGGNLAFNGGGGSKSTVTYDAGGRTLTILIGAKSAGTQGTAPPSIASLTSDTSITDAALNPLFAGPFVTGAAAQF